MEESLEIQATYKPAWSFAKRAATWAEKAKSLPAPFHIGEPALLAFLYSALSLEAFVDEELTERLAEAQYAPLYGKNVSLTQRWKMGATLLALPESD